MPGIILGAPYLPPVPPSTSALWPGISAMTWTGWGGSVWDLISGTGGVTLQRGARGHDTPPEGDRYTSTSPALAGSRNRGSRDVEREVYWPLKVSSNAGSQAWVEVDRALWKTLSRRRTGLWSVTAPDGNARTLLCRFDSVASEPPPVDPMLSGWRMYGVSLVAEQPYWQGAPVTRIWKAGSSTPFFGGVPSGSGAPFVISSGSTIASATIANPGDVDAYPVYTIVGPIESVSVGYDGNVVDLGAIASGQTRIVDTRPDKLTVTDQDGIDRWSELGASAEFDAPIPPGDEVTLTLAMVGAGTVSASLVPLFDRAW